MRRGLKIRQLFLAFFFVLFWGYVFSAGTVKASSSTSDFVLNGTTVTGYNGSGGAITLPNGVTGIAGYVFQNKGITSVSGTGTLEQIGEKAFADNAGLTSFTIPSSLDTLAQNAFSGTSISSFNGSSGEYTTSGGSIYSGSGSTLYIVPPVASGSVIVADTANTIATGAFSGVLGVTDLYIPKSVTTIADGATTGSGVIAPDGTIYGYNGTAAETYAKKHTIRFVSLDSNNNNNNNNTSNTNNTNSGSSTNSGGTTTYVYYDDDDDDDADDD
ncbi:MAG: leucine-rich repeat protein, partial [Lachnospiraceae bacterium]|nr:leucine-rich repeat protein [Lachnospiraceae bacterium]